MAWQRGVCWLFPSTPWAGTSEFRAFLMETLIIFVVERCWLTAGLTEAVLEDTGGEMGSLGSLFYWLASLYYFHWPVHFFCIFIVCDFIWTFHIPWDITFFQMKLDCSCIGNAVKLQLGDNAEYFADLAWVRISYFSLQCKRVLESPSLLLWKVFLILFSEPPPADLFLSPIVHTPFLVSVLRDGL